MYESYFRLKSSPFNMTPDPSSLFWTAAHREALAGLTYAVTCRKGLVVLTGPAGTGKTTLLRKLLDSAPVPLATSFVYNPNLTATEFLDMALSDFDLPVRRPSMNKAEKLFLFERFLLSTYREGKTAALLVDEAHRLSPEVLEEIRLFMNFETSEEKLLQIVLAGQPELNETLNRDDLQQIKQRVAAHLRTRPLSAEEVRGYLVLRWTKAGGSDPIPFSDEAVELIYRWSKGIPRVINGICDNALISARGSGRQRIGPAEILEVARDLGLKAPPTEIPLGTTAAKVPVAEHAAAVPQTRPAPVTPIRPPANGLIRIPFRDDDEYEEPPQTTAWGRWAERLGMRPRRQSEMAK